MNKTSTVRLDKLKKLSEHMLDDRGHTEFDFGHFYNFNSCGTTGCMAGELPFLFPDEWTAERNVGVDYATVVMKANTTRSTFEDLSVFFGITSYQTGHLFNVGDQQSSCRHDGELITLEPHASLGEVVENLDSFILLNDPGYQAVYDERWGG